MTVTIKKGISEKERQKLILALEVKKKEEKYP